MRGLSPVPQKIPNFSGEADGCHGRFEDNEVKLFVESCQSDLWYLLPTCDRSSSSSATSPASRVPSNSPDWEEPDVEVRVEESGDGGDSINTATAPISPSLSKLNNGSMLSPPLPQGAVVARKIEVLQCSNGYALPGTMTVIMGTGKSGKSTLLTALPGRLDDSAKTYGEVFINGAKPKLQYESYRFLERKNTLIGSLTVRDFLYYSALLQFSVFFYQKKSVVDDAILAMSLGDYANKLIGGHCYMKGLPSGERRRVSIARKLVMRLQVLFIDEPLHQLDRSKILPFCPYSQYPFVE
ncbi:unnamed protein product [Lactuca saligna]|uniref:ABC transporter domain-containing protein n=1 Tax=Lactuca saligna TaxID=75948 RepID=A0AA35YQT7_LACSI|nr:unnamed protein product [Lactuca saligna]